MDFSVTQQGRNVGSSTDCNSLIAEFKSKGRRIRRKEVEEEEK